MGGVPKSFLSEMRLDLDPVLQAPARIASRIDPNIHSCGTAAPSRAADLSQPDPGLYPAGMKSYGHRGGSAQRAGMSRHRGGWWRGPGFSPQLRKRAPRAALPA